jgi:superfamily II DNA/RNA helicase
VVWPYHTGFSQNEDISDLSDNIGTVPSSLFQIGAPKGVSSYLHRAGRTGRAGKAGLAVLIHSSRSLDLDFIKSLKQKVTKLGYLIRFKESRCNCRLLSFMGTNVLSTLVDPKLPH